MCKSIFGIFLFLNFIPQLCIAQWLPAEYSKLNYRLIGFSFPGDNAAGTKIEIAAGDHLAEDSFSSHIIKTYTTNGRKVIGEVPAFGAAYTWRTTSVTNGITSKSALHHFSTGTCSDADTAATRLRVFNNKGACKDHYIFMDGTKALYDMEGRPVWFLPGIDGLPLEYLRLGDLKATPRGTITFMTGRRSAMIYEVDYNGTIRWRGAATGKVSGDTTEHYNHEFTRLSNGHYMVLGFESVPWRLPGSVDSSVLASENYKGKIVRDSGAWYQKIFFYTLIEYDEEGNVVWVLRTSRYFKQWADSMLRVNAKGVYDMDELLVNSFYMDEDRKEIYLSFRDIGRVLKVAYPTGNILGSYGNVQRGSGNAEADLFCWQHACSHSPKGYLCLFNNNICHPGSLPHLTILGDPAAPGDTARKIWEYNCTIDGIDTTVQKKFVFSNGGSVTEIEDGAMFSCMSTQNYTKVFIVNRNKKELWSAIPEKKSAADKVWRPVNQYRASIITAKELEQLIWTAEKRED